MTEGMKVRHKIARESYLSSISPADRSRVVCPGMYEGRGGAGFGALRVVSIVAALSKRTGRFLIFLTPCSRPRVSQGSELPQESP